MKLKTTHSSASRMRILRNVVVSTTLAAAVTTPVISQAEVPAVDAVGRPANVLCEISPGGAPVRGVHMDKVIFRITDFLLAAVAADQPALNAVPRNSRLDIKVLDDPRTVADLKGKVLTFLGAVDGPINRERIVIDDVDYAVVCPNPETLGGGGD